MHIQKFLSEEQVYALTGYSQANKQIEALIHMGITFKVRARDGKPIVLSSAVEEPTHSTGHSEPDFSVMEAKQ